MITTSNKTNQKAKIDTSRCLGCQSCIYICEERGNNAISWDEANYCPKVDKSKCIGCGHCADNCPCACIELSEESDK